MYVDRWLFVICQWLSTIGKDSKELRTSESISRIRGPASPTPLLLYVLFSFKFIIRLTERVEQNLNILSSMTFKSISTHTKTKKPKTVKFQCSRFQASEVSGYTLMMALSPTWFRRRLSASVRGPNTGTQLLSSSKPGLPTTRSLTRR